MKQNSSRKKTHEPRNEDGKLKKEKKARNKYNLKKQI